MKMWETTRGEDKKLHVNNKCRRRILYGMEKMKNTYNKPYSKSAKSVGYVMGSYHPHGDCLSEDTKVSLLDGSIKTMKELYDNQESVEVLSIDKEGKIVPSVAHSFRVGQRTDKKYKINFHNGYSVEVTGNHPFLLTSGDWVKAEELTPNMIIEYANITSKGKYSGITGSKTTYQEVHSLVVGKVEKGSVIHHKNHNPKDNRKENLGVLSRGEHALEHKDYLKGLDNGRQSMFDKNGKHYEKTKNKNRVLIRQLNKQLGLVRANNAVNILKNKGVELTHDNYESLRGVEVKNLPYIERLVDKGTISSFEDLVERNRKGIKFIDYKKPEVEKEDAKKNTYLPNMVGKQLKMFARVSKELNFERELKVDDLVNTRGINSSKDKYTDEDLYEVFSEYLPIIKSIDEVETQDEPMYDFTVDGYENMLIPSSEDGDQLMCVHNSSIYGALANMAKPWNYKVPLIDFQGK